MDQFHQQEVTKYFNTKMPSHKLEVCNGPIFLGKALFTLSYIISLFAFETEEKKRNSYFNVLTIARALPFVQTVRDGDVTVMAECHSVYHSVWCQIT